jgi:hypothetical protein
VLVLAHRVRAADSPFQASLSCQPAVAPGRILCELSTRVNEGKLVWSDALVVRAPGFARPLRSRVVAHLDADAAALGASAKLALVASEAGQGKLTVLARGVLCHDGPAGEHCGPVQAQVTVEIRVAQPSAPAP